MSFYRTRMAEGAFRLTPLRVAVGIAFLVVLLSRSCATG